MLLKNLNIGEKNHFLKQRWHNSQPRLFKMLLKIFSKSWAQFPINDECHLVVCSGLTKVAWVEVLQSARRQIQECWD